MEKFALELIETTGIPEKYLKIDLMKEDLIKNLEVLKDKVNHNTKLNTEDDVFEFVCDLKEFYHLFKILGVEGEETMCENMIVKFLTISTTRRQTKIIIGWITNVSSS